MGRVRGSGLDGSQALTDRILFDTAMGDSLVGADGVTIGNSWSGIGSGCGHILVDSISVEAY